MSNLRRNVSALSIAALLVAGFGLSATAQAPDTSPDNAGGSSSNAVIHAHSFDVNPNPGRDNGVSQASCTGCLNSSFNVTYHSGGEIMSGGVTVYPIFYGNWNGAFTDVANFTSSAENKANVLNFLNQVAASSVSAYASTPNHYNINSDYYKTSATGNVYVSKSIAIGASIDVAASKTVLTDADVQSIVDNATNTGGAYGSADPKGIYLVLTSAGISDSMGTSKFLTNYCGYHGYYGTAKTKYSFVGDASASLGSCAGQVANSPHSSSGHNLTASDAMVSVVMHEIEEAVTDPLLNAWFDRSGYENGDKCAWKFGTTYPKTTSYSTTAAKYNYTDPSSKDLWFIQQNVKLSGSSQGCAITR